MNIMSGWSKRYLLYTIFAVLFVNIIVVIILHVRMHYHRHDNKVKTKILPVIPQLRHLLYHDETFRGYVETAILNAQDPPSGCTTFPPTGEPWCWNQTNVEDFIHFFESWLTITPTPKMDGFVFYTIFYDLCYGNKEKDTCLKIVQESPGLNWTFNFTVARGQMMNSTIDPKVIDTWKDFLGKRWDEYVIPKGGFKSYNEFFTRELKAGVRPISRIDDSSVMTAVGDTLVNVVHSELTKDTKIHTKGYEKLNVEELLHGSIFADKFIGGTAVSNVLLPTVYHWYHSPVSGVIRESKILAGTSFEMGGEFYDFLNKKNIGAYHSDFGVFGVYHRGYLIIETEKHGFVGYVAVGLDDVNSVIFEREMGKIGGTISKGQRVGRFQYGGSLVIVLFQKDVFSGGITVEMGGQIGLLEEI